MMLRVELFAIHAALRDWRARGGRPLNTENTSAAEAVVNVPPVVGSTRLAVTAATAVTTPVGAPDPEPKAKASDSIRSRASWNNRANSPSRLYAESCMIS